MAESQATQLRYAGHPSSPLAELIGLQPSIHGGSWHNILRVVLDCQPSILDAVLSAAIRQFSDITLVPVDDDRVDIVITTHDAETGIPLYLLSHPVPNNKIITIDREENILRIWELIGGGITERIFPGDLPTLLAIIRGKIVRLQ